MRIPTSTYRIQFNHAFGFRAAYDIIPYLAELGISDLYASPIFAAKKGSLHGYDVVDPNSLNPELGSLEDFNALSEALKKRAMGWLQDVVLNHMAFDHENAMLTDMLENGSSSEFYRFFDIEWEHPTESIRGKLLAPFLGKFYGDSLENGELELRYGETGLTINYYDLRFPLKIESYHQLFAHRLDILKEALGEDHPDFIKFAGILYVLKSLGSEQQPAQRYDQVRFIKGTLWELYCANTRVKNFVDQNIVAFNGIKGNPESFKPLEELLAEQLFRLAFWKVATEEINYRRFFNINELICLRVEDDEVFDRAHRLLLNLMHDGTITGLRIDHIDGLFDPTAYLKRLRLMAPDVYLVVEKILDLDEELPSFWNVQGSTGYDFLNYVNGMFCQNDNERQFDRIYAAFTGLKTAYDHVLFDKKALIIEKHMVGDIDNLAHLIKKISSRHRYGSDFTIYGLKEALTGLMAQFPIYRTYISETVFRDMDHAYIRTAAKHAAQSNPKHSIEIGYIEKLLLLEYRDYMSEEEMAQVMYFLKRFQQFTGPLMAKGLEDTTFYVYNRLLSLNEVGGDPERFGITIDELHAFNARRNTLWPNSLNTTSTHDTKRGEDVRARLDVLSEIPKEWENRIKTWARLNRTKKKKLGHLRAPDRNDEYLLYQTLLGAYPFDKTEYDSFVTRIKHYIVKAVREAKVHTAWLKPDTDYEDAFVSFIDEILKKDENNAFLNDFLPFQMKIAYYGIFNSLSQTLIKITSPGIPDFYQGSELWDFNLVDPDNRRPVDFEKRNRFVADITRRARSDAAGLISDLLQHMGDGRIKLFLIQKALKARNDNCELFTKGSYLPLAVSGERQANIFAFARNHDGRWAVTAAPRLLTSIITEGEYPLGQKVWADTCVQLPADAPTKWKNALTGEQLSSNVELLPLGDVLRKFPAGLLLSEVI
ncbi:MAG: malto-oligosyltrehalose synthase [Candidatus Abyssubacteria bacterium]